MSEGSGERATYMSFYLLLLLWSTLVEFFCSDRVQSCMVGLGQFKWCIKKDCEEYLCKHLSFLLSTYRLELEIPMLSTLGLVTTRTNPQDAILFWYTLGGFEGAYRFGVRCIIVFNV